MIRGRRNEQRARRFWAWFNHQSQGFANGLEALMRGEADADQMLNALNLRLRAVDAALACDLARAADGVSELRFSGPAPFVFALIETAPAIRGWRFVEDGPDRDPRRAPWRITPRPALDFLAAPISGVHEAWA